MASAPKQLAVTLTAGVALASGAYGVGSQVRDGSATASGDPAESSWHGREVIIRSPFDPSRLAAQLGVDEKKFEDALADLQEARVKHDSGERLAADLAEALGVSEERVALALDRLGADMEERHAAAREGFAADLADALGIEAEKARSVFEESRPEPAREPGDAGDAAPPPPGELAKKLGVSEKQLLAAFEELRPDMKPAH